MRIRTDLHNAWRFESPENLAEIRHFLKTTIPSIVSSALLGASEALLDSSTDTVPNDYDKAVRVSAMGADGKIMSIHQYCDFHGLNINLLSSWKIITHTGVPYYNIVFKEMLADGVPVDYEAIISEAVVLGLKEIPALTQSSLDPSESEMVSRLVYTDCHIGMDVNPDGNSVYGGIWNENEFFNRIEFMAKWVIKHAVGDVLYIDELGDYLDGLNGKTVRGGHDLPQNLTDDEALEVGIAGKLLLLRIVAPKFKRVVFNTVEDDNHSGKFAAFLNIAVEKVVSSIFKNVEFNRCKKFFSHYFVGKHCFVICHGKDSKYMKYGLKVAPSSDNLEKIDQYCKANDIYKKSKYVHFCKGDSHQKVFDYTSSQDFDYMNYPAFSPSSGYVQANFKKGISGFGFEIFSKNDEDIFRLDKNFAWKKQ